MVKKLMMVALVALAAGMAYPPTRAQIQANTMTPLMNVVGSKLVPRRLEVMADQLDVILERGNRLPQSADDFYNWLRVSYSGQPEDPWGNVYFLQIGRRDYTVGTVGPDGVQGTDDDYTVTRSLDPRGRR